ICCPVHTPTCLSLSFLTWLAGSRVHLPLKAIAPAIPSWFVEFFLDVLIRRSSRLCSTSATIRASFTVQYSMYAESRNGGFESESEFEGRRGIIAHGMNACLCFSSSVKWGERKEEDMEGG
ncbi:unnamed protein product, partial [Ectocarpus sp. 8 AP-2014]